MRNPRLFWPGSDGGWWGSCSFFADRKCKFVSRSCDQSHDHLSESWPVLGQQPNPPPPVALQQLHRGQVHSADRRCRAEQVPVPLPVGQAGGRSLEGHLRPRAAGNQVTIQKHDRMTMRRSGAPAGGRAPAERERWVMSQMDTPPPESAGTWVPPTRCQTALSGLWLCHTGKQVKHTWGWRDGTKWLKNCWGCSGWTRSENVTKILKMLIVFN